MENVFEKWKIEECIGEGAFGKVYRITREEFGHKYSSAMKVLHIPQSDAEVASVRNEGMTEANLTQYFESMVTNIIEEFTLMEKLKGNSYIVSCEDHEVIKRTERFGWDIYIRMELLTPLFKYVNEKGFSVLDVVHLGIDICRALEICQKYNIIHRDIKPENIFVSDVGDFKLGDFGIARELDKTSGGLSKKGTRNYMAPEVYKGEAYNSTIDIYSLGIVMYRFLNGNRLPFLPLPPNPILYSDKEYAEMSRMSGQPMPAPIDAPPELARAVLKACAYLPSERYSSAKEMRKDLERILYLMDDEEEVQESNEEQMPSYSEIQPQNSMASSDYLSNNSSKAQNVNQGMQMSGNMSLSGNFGQDTMQLSSNVSQSDSYEGTVQLSSKTGTTLQEMYEGTVQLGSSPGTSKLDDYEGTVQLGSSSGTSKLDDYEGTVQLGSSFGASKLDDYEGTVQLGRKMPGAGDYEGIAQTANSSDFSKYENGARPSDGISKITSLDESLNGFNSEDIERKEKNNLVKILIASGVVVVLAVFIIMAVVFSQPKQQEGDTVVKTTEQASTKEPEKTEVPAETTEEPIEETEEPTVEPTVEPTKKPKKTPKPSNKPAPKQTKRPIVTKKPTPRATKRVVVTRRPTPKKTNDPLRRGGGDGPL